MRGTRTSDPAYALGVSRRDGRLRSGHTLLELVLVLVVLAALAFLLVPALGGIATESQETLTRENLRRIRDVLTGPGGYRQTMRHAVEEATGADFGYATGLPWPASDDPEREDYPQLHFLFVPPVPEEEVLFDPVAQIGWKGPYLEPVNAVRYDAGIVPIAGEEFLYGLPEDENSGYLGDLAPADAWGRPIVLQLPDEGAVGVVDDEDRMYARLVSPGPNGRLDTPRAERIPGDRGDDILAFLFVKDVE